MLYHLFCYILSVVFEFQGLARAIDEVWPRAQHRHCVQHLYQNFKKENRGQALRDSLWYLARCTNKEQWKRGMDRLKTIDDKAHKWLIDHGGDPKHWCKA